MPIKEYKCINENCSNFFGFEHLHIRSTDTQLETCDKCGAPLEVQMSTFSAKFTGSGFYETDYKSKKKKNKKVEVTGETKTVTDKQEIKKIKKEAKKRRNKRDNS